MRPRALAVWASVGMLIVGSLVAAPPTSNAEFTASIVLSRTSGPVGAQVGVTGNGFDAVTGVELRWDGPAGSVLATGTTTPNGTVSLTFTVPTAPTGQKSVVVCQTTAPCGSPKNNLHRGGFAYFTVTTKPPPSTTTTTSPPSSTTPPSSSVPVTPSSVPVTPSANGATLVRSGPGSIVGDGVWGPVYVPDLNRPVIPDEGVAPRCTATPSSTIVDFDDVASGTDIREAYSSLGVRFTAVQYDDSTTPRPDVPITAQSWLDLGSVSEPNIARLDRLRSSRERSAIRLDFDRPQRVIGLHVGTATNLSGLFSLRAPGDTASDSVYLATPGPHPVSTCMLIVVPEGTTTATIRVEYEALLIDRVFFSEENDFVRSDVLDGTVYINEPSYRYGSRSVDVSEPLTVSGWAAQVLGPADTTPRTYDAFYVSYVNAAGTGVRHAFAPWRRSGTGQAWSLDNVELPTGPFRISVVAVGPGVVARAVRDFVGFTDETLIEESAPSFDIVPIGMEVTQGLSSGFIPGTPGGTQTARNVDVAGRATVVRAFAELVRVPGSPPPSRSALPVRAWLFGFSGGRVLPGSPLTPANNSILVSERDLTRDLDAMRSSTSAGWNFHLPLSWTEEGSIRLMLWVNPPGASQITEAAVPGSELNSITMSGQRFEAIDPRATTAYLVHSFWRQDGEVRDARPTLTEVNTAVNRWEQLFPVPYGGVAITSAVVKRWAFRTCVEGESSRRNGCSEGAVPDVPVWDNQEIYDEQPEAVARGGEAFIPIIFSPQSLIGCSGRANYHSPVFHGGACGPTLAQEAGHSLGLVHLSTAHAELSGGAAFERAAGDHGEMEATALGWDLATDTAVLRTDGSGHRHDFMSYGGGTPFVTLDTWNKVATALRASNYLSDTTGPSIRAGSPRGTADIKTLIITVGVSGTDVTLSPVSRTPVAVAPTTPVENPAITVRVTGTSGTNTARMLTGAFTHDLQIWTPEYTVAADDPGGVLRIEVVDTATNRVLRTFDNIAAADATPPTNDEVVPPATMPLLRTLGGDSVTPPNRTIRFDADAPGGLDGLTITWLLDGEPQPELDGQSSIDIGAPVGTHRITLQLSDGKNTGSIDRVFVVDDDTDRDGLGDTFEQQYRLDPQSPNDAVLDGDADGLDNVTEQRSRTDPTKADTDGDRYRDDVEVAGGSDPNDPASRPVALHTRLGEPVPMIGEGDTTTTDTVAGGGSNGDGDDGSPWLGAIISIVALAVVGAAASVIVVRRRTRSRTTRD